MVHLHLCNSKPLVNANSSLVTLLLTASHPVVQGSTSCLFYPFISKSMLFECFLYTVHWSPCRRYYLSKGHYIWDYEEAYLSLQNFQNRVSDPLKHVLQDEWSIFLTRSVDTLCSLWTQVLYYFLRFLLNINSRASPVSHRISISVSASGLFTVLMPSRWFKHPTSRYTDVDQLHRK